MEINNKKSRVLQKSKQQKRVEILRYFGCLSMEILKDENTLISSMRWKNVDFQIPNTLENTYTCLSSSLHSLPLYWINNLLISIYFSSEDAITINT